MNSFIRIRLYQVPAQFEDVITQHSFDFGATGLTEVLDFVQPNLKYEPLIIAGRTHVMDIFFTKEPDVEFFKQMTAWSSQIKWEINTEEDKDWLAEWKKGFKAFALAGPYWIIPSWIEAPAEAQVPIFIDPGMAFGTGTHATTRMASYFVHKVAAKMKSAEPLSFLDVGTGTAVLAILAKKEKFHRILALDIDPEARRVARENIERNGAADIEIPDVTIEEVHEAFDVVVANIIDGVLVELRPFIFRAMKPKSHLFVTGILKERDDKFVEDFIEGTGLKIVRRLTEDGWVGYWLQRED